VRNLMKQALEQSHSLFWRGADADPAQLKAEVAFKRWGQVASALDALDPKTPSQKDALAGAKANFAQMEQTRLLMSLQLSSSVGLVAGDHRDPMVDVSLLRFRRSIGD